MNKILGLIKKTSVLFLLVLFMVVLATDYVNVKAEENVVTVYTLKDFNKAIKAPGRAQIYFICDSSKTITIEKCEESADKVVSINAPKAKVVNKTEYLQVEVVDCKYYREKASNKIKVIDNDSKIFVEAGVKNVSIELACQNSSIYAKKNASIDVVYSGDRASANAGEVNLKMYSKASLDIELKSRANLVIKGSDIKKATVNDAAYLSEITTYVPINIFSSSHSYSTLNLKKGSENSVLNITGETETAPMNIVNSSNQVPKIVIDGKVVQKRMSKKKFNDESRVYKIITALKNTYPEGLKWTNENNTYMWKGSRNYYGMGCVAFAFILSDAAFGYNPARQHNDFNNIKVGDVLRINHDSHSVVVLKVEGDVVTIAEGNYNSSVHWGRTLSKKQLINGVGTYVTTRYLE